MRQIHYQTGIRKLKNSIYENLNVGKDALDLLEGICQDLHSDIIDNCKSDFKRTKTRSQNKNDQLDENHIRNVIGRMFQLRMHIHAVAEGNKAVFMLHHFLLHYNPTKALHSKKASENGAHSKVDTDPPNLMFVHKLGAMLERVDEYGGLCLTPKAKICISDILYDIARMLSLKAARIAGTKLSLDIEDVDEAVEESFQDVTKLHARSEAFRHVQNYNDGIFEFNPIIPKKTAAPLLNAHITHHVPHHGPHSDDPALHHVFYSGIRTLGKGLRETFPLKDKSVEKVNEMLMNVAHKLGSAAVHIACATNSKTLTPQIMGEAVNQVMHPALIKYAESEGNKAMLLYHNKMLVFKPKPHKTVDLNLTRGVHHLKRKYSSQGSFKLPLICFRRNILELFHEMFGDEGTIDLGAIKDVDIYLTGVFEELARECVAATHLKPTQVLTPDVVRQAVEEMMFGNTKEYALNQADKVMKHCQGENKPMSQIWFMEVEDQQQPMDTSTISNTTIHEIPSLPRLPKDNSQTNATEPTIQEGENIQDQSGQTSDISLQNPANKQFGFPMFFGGGLSNAPEVPPMQPFELSPSQNTENETIEINIDADQTIQSNVDADQTIQSNVDADQTIQSNVDADQTMQSNVDADQTMQSNVDADQTIQSNVDADQTIQSNVDADQTIQSNVDADQTIQSNSDTDQTTKLNIDED